jgi:hypothetical protein
MCVCVCVVCVIRIMQSAAPRRVYRKEMRLKERSQQFTFIAAVCMQTGEFSRTTPGATDNRRSAAAGSCSDRNVGSKSAGSPPLPDDRTCSVPARVHRISIPPRSSCYVFDKKFVCLPPSPLSLVMPQISLLVVLTQFQDASRSVSPRS